MFLRDHHCKITPSVQLHLLVLVHFVARNAAAVVKNRQKCQNRVSFCLVAPAFCFLRLCCSSDGTSPTRQIVNQSIPNRARLPLLGKFPADKTDSQLVCKPIYTTEPCYEHRIFAKRCLILLCYKTVVEDQQLCLMLVCEQRWRDV